MSRLGSDIPGVFAIDVEPARDVTVVRVEGELDLATADELERTLIELAAETVVVDLGRVAFLDSTALGALLRVNAARPFERPLYLLRPGQGLRRVFEITGVDGRFRFISSVEEAASA